MDRTSKTLHQAKKGFEKLILGVSDVLPNKTPIHPTNSKMSDRKCKWLVLLIVTLLAVYFVLDYYLYLSVQTGSLFDKSVTEGESYSPFHPLSIKLLVTSHSGHYVFTPLADYFNRITRFSEIFTFITPNVVTITHLCISIICFKFFASDSLRNRRIGILLFQIRIFLDALDGVIYRARATNKVYTSNRNEFGYYVDIVSDILGGVSLYVSIMYYYLKNYSNIKFSNSDSEHNAPPPSRRLMSFRFVCVGFFVLLSSFTWDRTIQAYEQLLQVPSKDSAIQGLQVEAFHKTGTFVIFCLWKIAEGETLIQMTLFAVFIDKVWEFFRYMQYVGISYLIILNAVTMWHLHYLANFLESGQTG